MFIAFVRGSARDLFSIWKISSDLSIVISEKGKFKVIIIFTHLSKARFQVFLIDKFGAL